MTEEEAKTKWCPFARVVTWQPDGHSFPRNRVVEVEGDRTKVLAADLAGARCIGSACMAWRWSQTPTMREEAQSGHVLGEGNFRDGYCGPAGKP